ITSFRCHIESKRQRAVQNKPHIKLREFVADAALQLTFASVQPIGCLSTGSASAQIIACKNAGYKFSTGCAQGMPPGQSNEPVNGRRQEMGVVMSQRRVRARAGTRGFFVKLHFTGGVAIGALAAALAWPGSAQAACSPTANAAGPNNTTVTCSGTTTNQNSPDGYGTGQQNNNT